MNLASGKQVEVQVMRAKSSSGDGLVWPIVIGILCILVAGGDITFRIIDMMPTQDPLFADNNTSSHSVGYMIGNSIGILLAVWLLLGGIGILRKTQAGAATLLKWAKIRTIIGATCFSLLLGTTLIASSNVPDLPPELGGADQATIAAVIAITLIVAFILNLAWPIFIWIWLTRSRIESQIGQWS